MTYRDFIYTSPSGTSINYAHTGELKDSVNHELGEFDFALVDNNYHQDEKINTGDYAFTLILSSESSVRQVRNIVNEKKTKDSYGTLQHPDPTLGTFPVVLVRADFNSNAVTDIENTYVNLIFKRTLPKLKNIESEYTTLTDDIEALVDELNVKQQLDFESTIDENNLSTIVSTATNAISSMATTLKPLSKKLSTIEIRFNLLVDDLLNNMDTLIYTPLLLAEKVQNLIMLPSEVDTSVNARLNAYDSFLDELFILSESEEQGILIGDGAVKNNIATRAILMLSTLSAMNYCAFTGASYSIDDLKNDTEDFDYDSYYSRAQVLEVQKNLHTRTKEVIDFLSEISSNFSGETFFKQYIDYSILSKQILNYTDKSLNSRLLRLPIEIRTTLDKPANIITLCYEYYNSIDLNLIKFFNKTNNIMQKEYYILNKGREIVTFGN